MKTKIFFSYMILCFLLAGVLCACGGGQKTAVAAPEITVTPQPTPEPTPEPTPVPTPAPPVDLPTGDAVTVDGVELESGSVRYDGVLCVRLSEAVEALGKQLQSEDLLSRFEWRGKPVELCLYEAGIRYGDRQEEMETAMFLYEGELWIPIRSFCEALDIGLFEDTEYCHLYCTPGAGNWELKEGVYVPVMMYHSVAKVWNGDMSLVVTPEQFRLQLDAYIAEGYEFIWFEDLAELDQYEKPMILTFDDGRIDNYNTVLPILQEYNIKATFYVITTNTARPAGSYMGVEELKEAMATGLISVQSHTVNHCFLDWRSEEALIVELEQSKLQLTRWLGKEPFTLAYPCGRADELVYQHTAEYYRFAVHMTGKIWCTGEDSLAIYRIGVYKGLYPEDVIAKIEANTYPAPGV